VIGQRQRIHALLRRGVDEVGDPPEAVEEAELRMDMQVREVVRSQGQAPMVAGFERLEVPPRPSVPTAGRFLSDSHPWTRRRVEQAENAVSRARHFPAESLTEDGLALAPMSPPVTG
jgi:hypothetical protein